MNRMLPAFLAAALALPSGVQAGGPVIIEEEEIIVAEEPASSVGLVPVILVGVVLCVLFCGSDGEEEPPIEPAG